MLVKAYFSVHQKAVNLSQTKDMMLNGSGRKPENEE
jgi:hypothetical protein